LSARRGAAAAVVDLGVAPEEIIRAAAAAETPRAALAAQPQSPVQRDSILAAAVAAERMEPAVPQIQMPEALFLEVRAAAEPEPGALAIQGLEPELAAQGELD
jgi:hypothetical protein